MNKKFYEVPCGDCRMCCKKDLVLLDEGEAEKFDSEPFPFDPEQRMIAHKKNGDCIYLRSYGCSIQGDKPRKCRTMDCRALVWPERQEFVNAALKAKRLRPEMIARAKELVEKHGPCKRPEASEPGE